MPRTTWPCAAAALPTRPTLRPLTRAASSRQLSQSTPTLVGWPRLLPPPPALAWRVTAAGLLDWCGLQGVDAPDLAVRIDASNPALALVRTLAGDKPRIVVAGDAQLATDVNWLFDNLRWDLEDDLGRLVGPAPARELARFGRGVATALRPLRALDPARFFF